MGQGMAGADDRVVTAEDGFRELDRSLRMNKMTDSVTSECSNRENKTVMGVHKILTVIFPSSNFTCLVYAY